MFGPILLALGIGVLAGLVISFVILTTKIIIDRVREAIIKRHRKKVVIAKLKALFDKVNQDEQELQNETTLSDLEKLFGTNGVAEIEVDETNQTSEKGIHILQTDQMESGLYNVLEQKNNYMEILAG